MIISVLCGGVGSRLWPLSRALMPKQFARLVGRNSLFELTLRRNKIFNSEFQIITNENSYFLAMDGVRDEGVKLHSCVLESVPRNTALALCIGALDVDSRVGDEVILSLPSDHIIHDMDAYVSSVREAIDWASRGKIVTFGIKPTSPHTGYGYIRFSPDSGVTFTEKPDLARAREYVESGDYYWNSGMFCYKARTLLSEMQRQAPEIYEQCIALFRHSCELASREWASPGDNSHPRVDSGPRDSDRAQSSCAPDSGVAHGQPRGKFLRLDAALSESVLEDSIDYALMEKTSLLHLVMAGFVWNDVGSFDSLSEEYQKDADGNCGGADMECIDSSNNLIISDKTVAAIGLNDFVVVDTFDALLIAKKGRTQDVKRIVHALGSSELVRVHNRAHRPWGHYTVLQEHGDYKIKSIVVKPKQRLSLQKHYHRNEHWIVVSGSAIVEVGDTELFLRPNESTYIPMGEKHRLSNPGVIDLVLIEVQVGKYLGEDDIVRLNDDYHR